MRISKLFATGLIIAALALSVQATPLAAGGSAVPGLGSLAGDIFLTSTSGTYSNTYENGSYTASVYSWSSGLDFVYTFNEAANSTSFINTVTTGQWGSFTTNVLYLANGNAQPVNATRDVTGNTVKFFFASGSGVGPGQTTDTLIVRTNAQHYTAGAWSVQNTLSSNLNGFQPTNVPEPISLALMGGGLLALGVYRRKIA